MLFFFHLIDEKQYSVKYSNYVAFSHFHGYAVNNPGFIYDFIVYYFFCSIVNITINEQI